MTSQAVVDLFKEQLNTELHHLAESRPYLNLVSKTPDPGMAFPHWYFERIEKLDRSDADELIIDGFDDDKIDAVHISDDGNVVRFFQFKNPQSKNRGIEDAAVDGLLTTIDIFLSPKRKKTQLNAIFDEIRSAIRTQYKIIFITSGKGLSSNQKSRIETKLRIWNGPNRNAFVYEEITLESLQDKVYLASIPTVNSNIEWKLDTPPYQTKINDHKSLICHIDGKSIAGAYENFGEKLLQQNIRNTEGSTPSNRDIYLTAISTESENFYFYNNGITIICDAWEYDQPSWRLNITRPQIVNGGQTVRQISAAAADKKLRENVRVLLRVISIGDNKEFAGNVAVNLNNQTIVKSSFLKSNHPFFIQMQHSLLPLGWYFERKQGDWMNLSDSERADLLSKITSEDHIIQMQTACRAYSAVYLQDIDLAKKNPKLIFLSKRSGGRFEDVATADFTPARLIAAYQLLRAVEGFTSEIKSLGKQPAQRRQHLLQSLLGSRAQCPYDELKSMLLQSSLLVSALVSHQLGPAWQTLPDRPRLKRLIAKAVAKTFAVGAKNPGSWATILKSQNFFEQVRKGISVSLIETPAASPTSRRSTR